MEELPLEKKFELQRFTNSLQNASREDLVEICAKTYALYLNYQFTVSKIIKSEITQGVSQWKPPQQ
jgi:hypothetical protein